MNRRTRRASTALAAVAALALGFGAHQLGITSWIDTWTRPQAPAPDPTYDYTALAAVTQELPLIDPTEEIPEYRRATFGERWIDIEGNGCDQRDDLLAVQLQDVVRDGCTVLSGVLDPDPYTGTRIEFEHDRIAAPGAPGSSGVQIDHIVSLSAAHAGGAWAWTEQQRIQFANSFDNIVAVDGNTNAAKNDHGPALWLPSNADYVCTYVARYTEIVDTWHLAVDEADRGALVDTLSTCAAQQASDESGSMS